MDSLRVDRKISELLDDPLVSLMIRADRVDRTILAGDLRRLAGKPTRGFMSRAGFVRPQFNLCRACGA
jgi:hypothetical protein